jgi:Flp pilus assembly protein TadG
MGINTIEEWLRDGILAENGWKVNPMSKLNYAHVQTRVAAWKRLAKAQQDRIEGSSRCARGLARLLRREDGGPLVEFGFVLPMMMMLMTGIFYLGVGMAIYMQLTNATEMGARQISISRGTTLGSDPCNTASTAFAASAPNLKASNTTYAFVIAGNSYSGTSCTAAALTAASQGQNAQVTVTYPVNLSIWSLGWGTINLKASTTEIIQ